MNPTPTRIARPMYAAILAILAAGPVGAAPRTPLEATQVECNRNQLGALVDRFEVTGPTGASPEVPQALFVAYSNRFGFYEGMVVGLPRFRASIEPPVFPPPVPGPEHQLGFHLNPSVRELLINPERIPLEQVSLTRETSTSTLVPPGDPFEVVVRLRPTLDGPDPVGPEADLVIDNRIASPADGIDPRPADTKPGRGLTEAGLSDLCHTRFTDFDRKVFAVLQRTLRAELVDIDRSLRYDTRIAIYRGTDPEEYRADIYAVDPETGEMLPTPLEARVRVAIDASGRLTDGHLELGVHILADAPDVVGSVQIVRPLFGGVGEVYEAEASFPVGGPLPGAPSSFYDFDWRDVLEGTAWNAASVETSECGQGTAEEIAATPRARTDLELAAIGMVGGVTADQAVYDRLDRDLASIRAEKPEVAEIPFLPGDDGRRVLVAAADATVYQAMLREDYREWDCLNDWYGLESVAPLSATVANRWVIVTLKGIYDLGRVADDYRELPGITAARPNALGYPAIPLPSLCATIASDGQTFRYFLETEHDLIYYFTTQPDGTVELVDLYSLQSLGPAPPPAWLTLAEECYTTTGAVRG